MGGARGNLFLLALVCFLLFLNVVQAAPHYEFYPRKYLTQGKGGEDMAPIYQRLLGQSVWKDGNWMATHLVKITLPNTESEYRLAFNKGGGDKYWQIDLSPDFKSAPNTDGETSKFWLLLEDRKKGDEHTLGKLKKSYFVEKGVSFFAEWAGEEKSPGHVLNFATRDALIEEGDSLEHLVGKVKKGNKPFTFIGIVPQRINSLGGGYFNDPDRGDSNRDGYVMEEGVDGTWALQPLPKGHQLSGGRHGPVYEGQPTKAQQIDLAQLPDLAFVAPAQGPQRGNPGGRGGRGGGQNRGRGTNKKRKETVRAEEEEPDKKKRKKADKKDKQQQQQGFNEDKK